MINDFYLEKETQEALRHAWTKNKHLSLQGFVDQIKYLSFLKLLGRAKREQVKIADRYSYSLILLEDIESFFNSEEFLSFLGSILDRQISNLHVTIKEFGWKDYTLLHDSEKDGKKIQIFFFMPSLDKWDYFWGGNRIYHFNEGKGKSLVFTPSPNTLNIIAKGRKDLSFTQYLNHYVGSEKLVIIECNIL